MEVPKIMLKRKEMDEQTLADLNSAYCCLPYDKHLINQASSVCMGESGPHLCVQTSLCSVCTHDLGQDSPI